MSKILFLAGIHGVGKSTLAEFLSDETGMQHYSSSELIKAQKQAPVDIKRSVIDPEDNQSYLLKALDRVISEHQLLILDGHFTLWDGKKIYRVSRSLFEALPIAGVILLVGDPQDTSFRLQRRDSQRWSINDIISLQDEEISQAKATCHSLNLPFLIVDGSYDSDLLAWVRGILE